jgi:hypothetical protein
VVTLYERLFHTTVQEYQEHGDGWLDLTDLLRELDDQFAMNYHDV